MLMNIRIRAVVVVFFVAIVSVIVLPTSGCRPADPTLVKIVSSLPRTGSAKQQSDTIVRGIRMAVDEAGGRVGPFRIKYLDLDDSTDATLGNHRATVRQPGERVNVNLLSSVPVHRR